jgi:hypothetical protein
MTGGAAGGLHRTLQTIPPRLLSTPWILAGAIRSIPGIGGCPPGRPAFAERNLAHWQSGTSLPFPVRTELFGMIPPPQRMYALCCRTRYRSSSLRVHPCVAAGTLQPPGKVIHDLSGREHGRSRESRVYRCPAGTCATTFRNTSTVNPTGYDPHDTREMPGDTSRSPFVSFQAREGGGHRVVSLRKGAGRRGDTGMRGSRNRSRASPRNLMCAAGCRTGR